MDFFGDLNLTWVNWGLYLSACWENDANPDTGELPFDYVANYQRTEVDTVERLYGGEIGLFHHLESNIDLLHEIYTRTQNPPVLDTDNPFYFEIVNGKGTSGIDFAVSDVQCGIFDLDEVPTIQGLLASEIGLTVQKEFLIRYLYDPINLWQVFDIYDLQVDYQAKCLLATYIYWCPWLIGWAVEDSETLSDLESMASYLIAIREYDTERILYLKNYIENNLTNEQLADF